MDNLPRICSSILHLQLSVFFLPPHSVLPTAAGVVLTPKMKRANSSKKRKGNKKGGEDATVTQCDDNEESKMKTKTKGVTAAAKKQSARAAKGGPVAPPKPVQEAYTHFVKTTSATGIQGLLDEFNDIKRLTQAIGDTPKVAFDANPLKNRYKDVFCVDESRVVLKWPEGAGNYVHANWAPIDEKRKYICTQGPIVATIEDFWRMIWQEKSKSILMLCNIVEQGKKKCEQYWPEGGTGEAQYGSVSVKVVKSREYMKFMTRTTLTLSDGTETLDVEHIQWNDWPDRGVPLDVNTVVSLIQLLTKLSPTTIHCSAGIGRTGTIVGLDMMLTKLKTGQKVSLKDVVIQLRARRHGSVQMDIQYLYMHRVLLADAVTKGIVAEEEIADFVGQYEALCKQRGFM